MTGDELRVALHTHNHTQASFAELLDVSPVTVNKWINGQLRRVPRYVALIIKLLEEVQQLKSGRMKR
jgi:DNA-binding transcriptional regulator YdaS (Cro superfamily)